MSTLMNYIIEANVGLVLFMLAYKLLLGNETQFGLQRTYLLGSICFSLIFPLLHLQPFTKTYLPTTTQSSSSYWLPEIVVRATSTAVNTQESYSVWQWIIVAYLLVTAALCLFFLYRIFSVVKLFAVNKSQHLNRCVVLETDDSKPSFSFFHFIFIGQASSLSVSEKEIILKHELVHVRGLHSLDILLVNALGAVFWFNPFVRQYAISLSEIHEYQADAGTVDNSETHEYCTLLTRLALQSSDFPIANHLNQSLTILRIKMLNTMKQKIQPWKIIALSSIAIIFFGLSACLDPIGSPNSTVSQTAVYRPEVQADVARFKIAHPEQSFTYIEGTPEDMIALIDKADKFKYLKAVYVWKKDGKEIQGALLSNVGTIAENFKMEGEVFTVVEQSAEPKNGMTSFMNYAMQAIRYPKSARDAGIEGTVYVEFVVNPDGKLSNLRVIKGIGGECDQEAMRVIAEGPEWNPALQRGVAVKQRMTMPMTFSFLSPAEKEKYGTITMNKPVISSENEKMSVTGMKELIEGKIRWKGKVSTQDGMPLPGVNIVLRGTPHGTVTDSEGRFEFNTDQAGPLVFSFIGFNTQEISF